MASSPRKSTRGAFVLLALTLAACSKKPEGPRPNILLITLDTTRPDYLGCYGYARPTSPNLDRLAADSVVFTRAYATSSWTLPTHASIFTGKLPSAHGAQYDPNGSLDLTLGLDPGKSNHRWKQYRVRPVSEGEITLAGILTHQGYSTAGIAGGPWLKKIFGLGKGFQSWDDTNAGSLNGRPASEVAHAAISFLDAHAKDPFFLFANFYDPHEPFEPAKEDLRAVGRPGEDWRTLEKIEQFRAQYAGEIHMMDRGIGEVLDRLRALGLYESTCIIAVADHGELLGEDYLEPGRHYGHGEMLTEYEIRVPLLVKLPNSSLKGRFDGAVQQTDLLPLILRLLELPSPPNVQGRSPIEHGAWTAVDHPIVAELTTIEDSEPIETGVPPEKRIHGDWRVGFDASWKYAWNSAGQNALVDLKAVPVEATNLFASDPDRASRMERALTDYLASLPRPGPAGPAGAVDPETVKALRRLGYLGGD